MTRTLALLAFVLAAAIHAEPRPAFELDKCAWEATDIVVVTEGADGLEVLETWKGTLGRGDRLAIPELTGQRMLLFLIRKDDGWRPANGEMKLSAAWIEDGVAHAFQQRMVPGAVELVTTHNSEAMYRAFAEGVLAAQDALREAMAGGDSATIVAAMPVLFRVESAYVARTALASLATIGPEAVPALRRVIHDDSLGWYHDAAIAALAKAGGDAAAPELAELLEVDHMFWREAARGLKAGWWNDLSIPEEERSGLRMRYGRTYAALTALRTIDAKPAEEAVTALRDLWRSQPQLRGVGAGQIERACEAIGVRRP